MIGDTCELASVQVVAQQFDSPFDGKGLAFGSAVILFSVAEGVAIITNEALRVVVV